MKSKYSIGLFIIIILITIFVVNETNKDKTVITESVTTDVYAAENQCFYLYEKNGYVVVYQNDRTTPYEYTDILFYNLPETLQIEIRNGKYISGIEELYGFLENYTS